MSNLIVTVQAAQAGFTGYARQGAREHQATATCPELAARLAAAELFGADLPTVRAEHKQGGTWSANLSPRRP